MIVISKEDKGKHIELLRKVCESFLYPGVSHGKRVLIHQILADMGRDQNDISVTCKFWSPGAAKPGVVIALTIEPAPGGSA